MNRGFQPRKGHFGALCFFKHCLLLIFTIRHWKVFYTLGSLVGLARSLLKRTLLAGLPAPNSC